MRPLDGVKVVDFTQAHAGSLGTMLLADFGAEVIKIERKGVGDLARYWEPMKEGSSAYFSYLNRGKKSIGLNAAAPEGKQIILELIKDADVVCENFKYGSMERMGLSYDVLRKANPSIIFASLNGFGQTGPLRERIGLDLQLQAMSGIMDRTGFPDGPPTKVGAALGDQVSGVYLAIAINLALIHKKRTGRGQRIDIAILDSLFSILEAAPITYGLQHTVPRRVGNSYLSIAPYDTFRTRDGYVSIGISTDRQWRKFCQIMGMETLMDDPRYRTNEVRGENYENGLKEAIEAALSSRSKFEVEELLREAKLACGAVYTVREAMECEQLKQREMLIEIEDHALGRLTMPGITIKLSSTPGTAETSAPLLGEHTRSVLKNLNYGDAEIESLYERQIVEGES